MATPVSVRLPDDLRERVRQLAADDRRSLGSMVVVLIEEAIGWRDMRPAVEAFMGTARLDADSDALAETFQGLSTKKTYRPDPKK